MCLAIPGQIQELFDGPGGLRFARVAFGSVSREVCLAYVPEAQVGEYVIEHAGFAIAGMDVEAAQATLDEYATLERAS